MEKLGLEKFLEDSGLKEVKDFASILESTHIRPTDYIEAPDIAWGICDGDDFISLGHCGDFSVIIGKAKSRKSFLINIAISAAVGHAPALGLVESRLEGKDVLYFDTEQSNYYVLKAVQRICRSTNIENPENLKTYALRSLCPSDRLEIIEYAINEGRNLGLVVIDGIRDLVTSINDEEQATDIASKLLKWTAEKNIHIITVLHQNKSDANARGHLGTELVNKAETVLSVTKAEKSEEISVVEAVQCRNKEPQPFAFEIIDGMPVLAQDWKIKTSSEKQPQVDNIEDYRLYQILNRVYSNGDSFGYGDLQIQIKIAFKEELSRSIGTNAVKEFISKCKNKGWLNQPGKLKPYVLMPYDVKTQSVITDEEKCPF